MSFLVTATSRSTGRVVHSQSAESMAECDRIMEEFFQRFNTYLIQIGYEIVNFGG
jgi:hypothetical protein